MQVIRIHEYLAQSLTWSRQVFLFHLQPAGKYNVLKYYYYTAVSHSRHETAFMDLYIVVHDLGALVVTRCGCSCVGAVSCLRARRHGVGGVMFSFAAMSPLSSVSFTLGTVVFASEMAWAVVGNGAVSHL